MRALKWVLIVWPLVLLVGLAAHGRRSLGRAEEPLLDPSRVVWGEGDGAVHVDVSEAEEGETLTLAVEARDARGRVLLTRELAVDRDHFGGGFVRAMQVDDDPDLEVVAWGLHEQDAAAFFLDPTGHEVAVRPFTEASKAAHAAALAWHQARHVDGLVVVVVFLLAFVYYVALGFFWLVVRAVRRPPRPAPAGFPGGEK